MSILIIPFEKDKGQGQETITALGIELLDQPGLDSLRQLVDAVISLEKSIDSYTIKSELSTPQFNAKTVLLCSMVRNYINADFLSVIVKLVKKVNEDNSNESLQTLTNIYFSLESNQQKSNCIETFLDDKVIDLITRKSSPLTKVIKDYLSIGEDQIKPLLIARILEIVLTGEFHIETLNVLKELLDKNILNSKIRALSADAAVLLARLEFHLLSSKTDVNLLIQIFKKSQTKYAKQIDILEKIQSSDFKSLKSDNDKQFLNEIKVAQALAGIKVLLSLGSTVTFEKVKEVLGVSTFFYSFRYPYQKKKTF